jgi:ATP-dependent DNA ligase
MLATLTDRRDFGDGWLLERKLDGERCVARNDGGDVRLGSRTGKDLTGTYPEVRAAVAAQRARDLLLGGEVVAYDGEQTSFSRRQYAGKVGTGYTAAMLRDLGAQLRELETPESPFVDARPIPRGTHWTRPKLVAQIGSRSGRVTVGCGSRASSGCATTSARPRSSGSGPGEHGPRSGVRWREPASIGERPAGRCCGRRTRGWRAGGAARHGRPDAAPNRPVPPRGWRMAG